jgi:hypothetical protein
LAYALPGSAYAVSIHGAVINGTTGATDVSATVFIIDPAEGMEPVHTVPATNGQFSIEKLDPGTYMARVDYQGVTYNRPFQIVADEHVSVTVAVYETTSSWDGIRVVVPHFTASRHDDHLVIERVYDIYNESQPPRTVAGKDGFFRFPLPEEMHSFNGLYVQFGDVPIEREPGETEEEGIYALDYPLRPGLTRVVMGYTAEYDTGAVALDEKLQYDIDQFTIFATDAEMEIASSSHELATDEGAHAGVQWDISGLKAGEVLNLSFRGGTSQESAGGGGQRMVIVVPNDAENLSLVLMVILLLALAAFTSIAVREPRMDGAEALRLKDYREILVGRLAKLDDLHETGAIPGAAYQAKRAEIKNQIASLMFRLDTATNAAGADSRERSHAQ